MRKLLLFCLCLLCVSCEESYPRDYDYYTLHPETIPKAYQDCRRLGPTLAYRRTECIAVFRAAEFVERKQSQRQNNPERFGLKILRAQMAHDQYQKTSEAAHAKLKSMDATEDVKAYRQAQTEAINAGVAVMRQELYVKQLLAVVRVTS